MSDFPVVLTPESASKLLLTSPEAIVAELESGRLRGFKVGDEWRVTQASLLDFIGDTVCTAVAPRTDNAEQKSKAGGVAMNQQLPDSTNLVWKDVEAFDHRWPDSVVEHFFQGHRTELEINGRLQPVIVGFTVRRSAGMDRTRSVVFFNDIGKTWPIVEFNGANDFETSGRMASVIKLPGGPTGGFRHLRSDEPVPTEYENDNLEVYRKVVSGANASAGVALIVDKSELNTMVRHALIRARWKGWI